MYIKGREKQIIKLKFLNFIFLMIMAIIMFVCLFVEEFILAWIIINIGWLGWVVLCLWVLAVIFIFFITFYIRKKQDEMEKKIENENEKID